MKIKLSKNHWKKIGQMAGWLDSTSIEVGTVVTVNMYAMDGLTAEEDEKGLGVARGKVVAYNPDSDEYQIVFEPGSNPKYFTDGEWYSSDNVEE
jgi:hypothetical protein